MKTRPSPRPRFLAPALLALAFAVAPPAARAVLPADLTVTAMADTMRMAIAPTPSQRQPGDTLLVELKVPVAGPEFNAYDAYLTYDPAVLQFLPAANVSTQEGPLMTAACGSRFHFFRADTLAGRLRVSHSLLGDTCSVTGPGVIYRVQFRCRNVDADTPLSLLAVAPYQTKYYMAGIQMLPLVTIDAVVRIGAGSTSGVEPPRVGIFELRTAPNPFNPRTTVSFTVEPAGAATVDVLTVDGRRVRRLFDGSLAAGPWSTDWDGRDDRGRTVAAGVYLVAVRGAAGTASTRVALVR